MQEYSQEQLAAQFAALGQLFDEVKLVDPADYMLLDVATLAEIGHADAVPSLDARGRAWQPQRRPAGPVMTFYQAITTRGKPCVIAATFDLPHSLPANSRDANAFLRLMNQYSDELCHDYVTGVYNRAYFDTDFRTNIAAAAAAGKKVSAAMVSVNEFAEIYSRDGVAAADRCLNTAAGILQIATGMETDGMTLARIEDGVFLVVAEGKSANELSALLNAALDDSRKTYSISLSRRGEFTTSVAAADWGEAGNWDRMLALADQRLGAM